MYVYRGETARLLTAWQQHTLAVDMYTDRAVYMDTKFSEHQILVSAN